MFNSLFRMMSTPYEKPEPLGTIKETESTKFAEPSVERKIMDGTQKIWRFHNGFGASVVQHFGSYGNEAGLWELAVLEFDSNGEWNLTYETPITEDVLGHLSELGVEATLEKIKTLKGET
jgi:hypothetical protein